MWTIVKFIGTVALALAFVILLGYLFFYGLPWLVDYFRAPDAVRVVQ